MDNVLEFSKNENMDMTGNILRQMKDSIINCESYPNFLNSLKENYIMSFQQLNLNSYYPLQCGPLLFMYRLFERLELGACIIPHGMAIRNRFVDNRHSTILMLSLGEINDGVPVDCQLIIESVETAESLTPEQVTEEQSILNCYREDLDIVKVKENQNQPGTMSLVHMRELINYFVLKAFNLGGGYTYQEAEGENFVKIYFDQLMLNGIANKYTLIINADHWRVVTDD